MSFLRNLSEAGTHVVNAAQRPDPLAKRAYTFLARRGGSASAAELVAHVFGTRAVERWRAMLEGMLSRDDRFQRDRTGWTLVAEVRASSERLDAFVAVAIATTGADPRRHRIVRLSAVHVAAGGIHSRFDVVVNSGRRLPRYLSEATRVNQESVEDAPTFAEIHEALREFVGSWPLLAYGSRWTRDFLMSECARAELANLANPDIELDDLAQSLPPTGRKPTLVALAEQLGISHPRPGDSAADADAVARVAMAIRASPEFAAVSREEDRTPRLSPAACVLRDRRWLTAIPDRPGVYSFLDAAGAVLYVGKAVKLRRRLSVYVGRSFALHRRLEALAARAADVRIEPTESDIEARLREATLIREHRPPFNVQRAVRPRSLLVRAAVNDSIPRLQLARTIAADGALYIGPFPSERRARAALALARATYPAACLRRAIDTPVQRDAVQMAVRLLTNHKTGALATLRARMRAASAEADHVAVDDTRRLIRAVLDFETRPYPLLGLNATDAILVWSPPMPNGDRRLHLVHQGRLVASATCPRDGDAGDMSALLQATTPRLHSDEDVPIVMQWLGELGADYRLELLAHAVQDSPHSFFAAGSEGR